MSTLLCSSPHREESKLDTRTVLSALDLSWQEMPVQCHTPQPKGRQGPWSQAPNATPHRIWLAHLLSGVYSWSTHLAWAARHECEMDRKAVARAGKQGDQKKMVNVLENTLASCIETASYLCVFFSPSFFLLTLVKSFSVFPPENWGPWMWWWPTWGYKAG